MDELKRCPICGKELEVYGPENWTPTLSDPDSGGEPYTATCNCGFSFSIGFCDYAEFLKAANNRADGWIPVAERLPEEGQLCVVYYGDSTYGVDAHCFDSAYVCIMGITQWMPLPEPPKGE